MEEKIKIVIIEDLEDQRIWLRDRLNETFNNTIEIIGEEGSVVKALELIETTNPDAVFLDIKLIGGNAFWILERLQRRQIPLPKIVLMTAYDEIEYFETAINKYQGTILYYLRRPFVNDWEAKLTDAIDAISRDFKKAPIKVNEPIVVMDEKDYSVELIDGDQIKINHADIRYLEADKSHKWVVLSEHKRYLLKDKSMSNCLKQFPNLIQVSKSCAINKDFFDKSTRDNSGNNVIILKDITKKIKIGEEYKGFIQKMKQTK